MVLPTRDENATAPVGEPPSHTAHPIVDRFEVGSSAYDESAAAPIRNGCSRDCRNVKHLSRVWNMYCTSRRIAR